MATSGASGAGLVRESLRDFLDDDCPSMAAALSYYTVFSLPPLLVLLLLLLGSLLNPQDIQGTLEAHIRDLMGPAGGEQIRTILAHAQRPGSGIVATVLGAGALVLGATGVFGQLQTALNKAWKVAPDPQRAGIRRFLLKRAFSLGMVLGLAFVLLVSLVLSAVLAAFGGSLVRLLPEGLSATLLEAINFAVSFGVVALLFAAIFKVLPDATISWADVWVGAVFTAALFVGGKFLLGVYLGHTNPGQAFGAAGALAVMFVWIYYSSMIVLLGAEFTQTWAVHRGKGIEPERGAVRVVRELHLVRPAGGR